MITAVVALQIIRNPYNFEWLPDKMCCAMKFELYPLNVGV